MKMLKNMMKIGGVVLAGVVMLGLSAGIARADYANVNYSYSSGFRIYDGSYYRYVGITDQASDSMSAYAAPLSGEILVDSYFAPASNYASVSITGDDNATGVTAKTATDVSTLPSPWAGVEKTNSASASADITMSNTFEVTQAGEASVSFSLEGLLKTSGDGNASYYLNVSDYNRSSYATYHLTSASGSASRGGSAVDDSFTFLYDFGAEDIGTTISLNLYLNVYARSSAKGTAMADFSNAMTIDAITGGLTTVPVPGAVWLLGSGLIGLAGAARRKMRK